MSNDMRKLFLLDGYALVYRAYYAMIRSPRINSKGLNTSAMLGFVNTLEDIIQNEHPTHVAVVFDPSGPTFRHIEFPDYKANREATPEDIKLAVPIIKEIIEAYNIPVIVADGYEADDVIGTIAKYVEENYNDVITYMYTPDKDYAQLVTERSIMVRPGSGAKGKEILDIEGVKNKFGVEGPNKIIDLLGLQGDTADNVPGCPGVGPKTAIKLISEYGDIEGIIAHKEELKGALKKRVEENVEKIRFSRYLVTIKTDVPIEMNLDSYELTDPDEEKLANLFQDLEFVSLMRRKNINKSTNKVSPIANPPQQDLFSIQPAMEPVIKLEQEKEAESAPSVLCKLEDKEHDYKMLTKTGDIKKLVTQLSKLKEFCIDTETTSINAMLANLVGISISPKIGEAYYIPIPEDYKEACKIVALLKPVIESETICKIGQNIKYDIIVLEKYEVSFKGEIWDTMVAHYLLQPDSRHNMDLLAEQYFNYETIHITELIGSKGKSQKNMRDLDPDMIVDYACEDADITYQLYHKLKPELEEQGNIKLFKEIEMPLLLVLTDMEQTGVLIDLKALAKTGDDYRQRLEAIEKEVQELSETEFNLNSPKQVGEILFDKLKLSDKPKKTKTGQYVTGEEVLEKLRTKHPIVGKILDYRGLKKLLSTYIEALPELINPTTGRIHTSFNQAVASTGRLSSSNPNLQNIPIRNADGREIRKVFIPFAGERFFSADYSQVELRIMAHLSQDENLIKAFNDGEDIHSETAAKLYHLELKDVDSEQRRRAKTANFGIIYGISPFGLSERLQIPRKEAKELIDRYFETYPGVKKYIERSIEQAKEKGYVETVLGRKRMLPDINSRNGIVRGYAERNAINAPIQGTAADIIKLSMIAIFRRFKEENIQSKMILQVHDELNFSVKSGEEWLVESIVKEEMENAYKMSVPLLAECGWGMNWLEAH